MPELPEVETYVRHLRPYLVGHAFTYVNAHWARSIAIPGITELPARLVGQSVAQAGRRGKYLRFWLDSGDELLIHLKMSGMLRIDPAQAPVLPHDRVVFGLDGGQELRLNDTRKWGRVYLIGADTRRLSPLEKLGPEPLSDEFTVEEFAQRVHPRSTMIKPLLMNQQVLAGIGNIYADESLFRARIHPKRKASSLSDEETILLYQSIRHVLQRSIECLGTSFDPVYTGGTHEAAACYQDYLQVYQRKGDPCPQCGRPIERQVVAGRGTHLCPHCQVDPGLQGVAPPAARANG